ncbi:MAG TPA: hypothetical protein VM681_09960 [Candidatus Thermoplasmatota archaeon]|nr:hypothetical protein [Candidatus Thermoplasmatota archaeon]
MARIRVPPSPVLLRGAVRDIRIRRVLFLPLAVVLAFLSFAFLGLATNHFPASLVLGALLGPLGAYLLVGTPLDEEARRMIEKTVPIPRQHYSLLFFPLGLVAAVLLYPLVGLALTDAGLVALSAPASMALSLAAGYAVAWAIVGLPRVPTSRSELTRLLPPHRRPLLFLPIALATAAVLYYGLGILFTGVLGPETAVAPAILLGLAGGFSLALATVGLPPAARRLELPSVPQRYEALVFALGVLVLGPVLALALGAIAGSYLPLPGPVAFSILFVAGYALAFGLLAVLRGLPEAPALSRYVPALPPEARPVLLLTTTAALGLVFTGLLETFVLRNLHASILVGFPLAFLVATKATRNESLVRDAPRRAGALPDAWKPLVLFPTWILASVLFYSLLAYVVPTFFLAFLASASLGLALALAITERDLLRTWADERRTQRQRRVELRRELKEIARNP